MKSMLPTQIRTDPVVACPCEDRPPDDPARRSGDAGSGLFNRRKARRKAQAEVIKLSQQLDPQARGSSSTQRQWGVLSENVIAKSQASQRRKVGKLFSKAMMTFGTAFDYENVSVQVAQIGERWRNRRDGFVDAKAEQVSISAHQLAAELEKQTRKVKDRPLRQEDAGIRALSSVFAFLTLGQMDQDSAAQFAFGKDSHGDQILYRDLRAGYAAKLKATQADHDFILDTLKRLNVSITDLGGMSEFIANSIGRQPEQLLKRVPIMMHKVDCPDAGTLEMTSADASGSLASTTLHTTGHRSRQGRSSSSEPEPQDRSPWPTSPLSTRACRRRSGPSTRWRRNCSARCSDSGCSIGQSRSSATTSPSTSIGPHRESVEESTTPPRRCTSRRRRSHRSAWCRGVGGKQPLIVRT